MTEFINVTMPMCGECKYHRLNYETGEWNCTCKESESYGCDTAYDSVCEEWEARP